MNSKGEEIKRKAFDDELNNVQDEQELNPPTSQDNVKISSITQTLGITNSTYRKAKLSKQ